MLESPVGRGSGLACVCPQTSMGCCRVPACTVLLGCACHLHVKFLGAAVDAYGAAECVMPSCVFVNICSTNMHTTAKGNQRHKARGLARHDLAESQEDVSPGTNKDAVPLPG
jgi:hypothetical protein